VEFRCKVSANLAAPESPTPLSAQEENKPPGHRRPPPHHQSTSCSRSLPSPCTPLHLLACLFSSVALYLRGYVQPKFNEVRVEFRCKASANLAAPEAPTPLSAQEENKPPGHRRPPPHDQSTSCSWSLPSACTPSARLPLFSSVALYLRGYVQRKCNEVRVEFRCKASAKLAAPKAPTPLSAQDENKPTGHRRPPPHHPSTSCSRSLPFA